MSSFQSRGSSVVEHKTDFRSISKQFENENRVNSRKPKCQMTDTWQSRANPSPGGYGSQASQGISEGLPAVVFSKAGVETSK